MINILLVDDRSYGLMAMEAVLDSPEYNLIKASSGAEALASLHDRDFAVILLDVQMPGMDGFETAKLIRQYQPTRETPIIFITAINKDSHHIARGYESGAVDYLFKPVDPDILRSKVKIFAELYTTRQTLKKLNDTLEERVRDRTAELVQTNKELEQFAYVASHDLQEPLRKIIIFSDRLKEKFEGQLDAAGLDHLDRLRKAGVRMKTVIEDLLMFSKVSAKEHTFEPVDLNELVREILSDLDIRINQQNAVVEAERLPTLTANKSQIRHLLQNLIINSLKFVKKDEPPHVTISSVQNGPFVEISVKDNGIGFDEKYKESIFKMFHRLHSQHEYEGSGIGLSICQKIAHQHGGRIGARSTPGQGATFTITLPSFAVPETAAAAYPVINIQN